MKSAGLDLDKAVCAYLSGSTVEEARGVTAPPITTYIFYKCLRDRGIELRCNITRKVEVPEDAILTCSNCGRDKPSCEFSKHSGTRIGYDTSRCKLCKRIERKTAEAWINKPLAKRILDRVKTRAKAKGIIFDLELGDIVIPEVCPVFGVPFIYGDHDWTYSLDRIKPELGYVKGNVVVMSNRANMLKGAGTTEEIGKLHTFLLALDAGEISF